MPALRALARGAAACALLALAALILAAAPTSTSAAPAPGSCGGAPKGPAPAVENPSLRYLLGVDGSAGWLDPDVNRSTPPEYLLQGLTDATRLWAGRVVDNAANAGALAGPSALLRFQAAPLAEHRFVNVTTPVTVHVAFKTTEPNPATAIVPTFSEEVEVHLYYNDREIGNGYAFRDLDDATRPTEGWFRFTYSFYPEVDHFAPDGRLSLEVVRRSSPQNFVLGLSGSQRSELVIPLLRLDQVPDPNTTVAHAHDAVASPAVDLEPPALLGLAALPPGGFLFGWFVVREARAPLRRESANAAVALALLLLASGCLGLGGRSRPGGVDPNEFETPGAGIQIDPGKGALRGQIRQDIGLPIPCAYVAILGTTHFTRTDARGEYTMTNVAPGQYLLRADKDGFASVEDPVEVRADQVTRYDVDMFPSVLGPPGSRPHRHHNWPPDAQELELFDSNADNRPVRFDAPTSKVCYPGVVPAEKEFVLPDDDPPRLVLPGTAYLTVRVDWDLGDSNVDRVGVWYESAGSTARYRMSPKAPGGVTHIHLTPDMADTGHETFTDWRFGLWMPVEGSATTLNGVLVRKCADVQFKAHVVAHRGVVPLEPGHEDWWGNASELKLFDGAHKHFSNALVPVCNACFQYATQDEDNDYWSYRPPDGKMVPPGTRQLNVRFSYHENGVAGVDPANLQFTLGFRTGADNPATTTVSTLTRFEGTSQDNVTEWVLDFDPTRDADPLTPDVGDLDAFYRKRSNWVFFVLAPDQPPWGGANGLTFRTDLHTWLTVTAVKDPSYRGTPE